MPATVRRPRFVSSGSAPTQLAAGVRAGPSAPVGYLGLPGDLTTLNPGDSLPGGWDAGWDGDTLIVDGNGVTVDHYRINAEGVLFTGTSPTMSNCQVNVMSDAFYGVTCPTNTYLTVTDTTVIGNASGVSPQQDGISADFGLIAIRCDISGTGDGIHFTAMPGTPTTISQCYIHDQAFLNEEQHCDGIQGFCHPTTPGGYILEHSYIASSPSTIGTPMNAGLIIGGHPADPELTGTIDNTCFVAGLYHLRINFPHADDSTSVTNNNLGTVTVDEFGLVTVDDPADILTAWSNNRTGTGPAGTGTVVPQPT